MRNKQILISGASIAGPALACWLGRHGFEVTVVELASELRRGGSAVDFRGEVNMTLLARMGILEDLRRVQTGGTPMRFVDATGRTRLYLPAEFAGGDIEVHRFDLVRILYDHSRNTTDYVFGDSITDLQPTAEGVHVTFASGKRRTFDLVIGADGIHSTSGGWPSARRRAMSAISATTSPLGRLPTSSTSTAVRCYTTLPAGRSVWVPTRSIRPGARVRHFRRAAARLRPPRHRSAKAADR